MLALPLVLCFLKILFGVGRCKWRGFKAQKAVDFPQESLLLCKSKLRARLGPMQSPSIGVGGLRDTNPSRRLQRRVTEVQSSVLTIQLQVPAGSAAKAHGLSWTLRAEPLRKCSPGHSGTSHWEMARPSERGSGCSGNEGEKGCWGVARRPSGRDTPLIRLWLWIRRPQMLLGLGFRSPGS